MRLFLILLTAVSTIHQSHALTSPECVLEPKLDTPGLCEANIHSVLAFGQGGTGNRLYQQWGKFTILVDEQGRLSELRFQNSNQYRFHAEYLTQTAEFRGQTPTQIDAQTLKRPGRRALLGTIFAVRSNEIGIPGIDMDYELISHDSLTLDEVVAVQSLLRSAISPFVQRLSYLPVAEQRDQVRLQIAGYRAAGIEVIFPEAANSPRCYHTGWTVGRLRFLSNTQFEKALRAGTISPHDLLVLESVPRELPPVAGILSAAESAPSSHVALLAAMMDVPFGYIPGIFNDAALRAREGEPYYLRLSGDGQYCQVSRTGSPDLTETEAQELMALKKPVLLTQPRLNTRFQPIGPARGRSHTEIPSIGGKAAHLSILIEAIGDSAPADALVIPTFYFERFLNEATSSTGKTLREYLNASLEKLRTRDLPVPAVLDELSRIDGELKKAEFPQALLQEIESDLKSAYGAQPLRLRLRSSSNVEDLAEFNGAGLYDSAGICLGDRDPKAASLCQSSEKADPLAKGLKSVWRSLYSPRAFLARRWFGIDESKVGMAILVHPSYEGELANGVAILSPNEWSGNPEAMITGFPGEELQVTHPPIGKTPETMKVEETWKSKITSSTEVPQGQNLLRDKEYALLFELMRKTRDSWIRQVNNDPGLKLDFEWKVMSDGRGGRRVAIKQVREVPDVSRRSSGYPHQKTFIGDRTLTLEATQEEDSDARKRLQTKLKVKLEVGLFTLEDAIQGRIPIERAEVIGRLGNIMKIEPDQIRVSVIQEEWRDYSTPSRPGRMRRSNSIQITLPNPEIPSLTLLLSIYEEKDAKGLLKEGLVTELHGQEMLLEAREIDIVPRKHSEPASMLSWGVTSGESQPMEWVPEPHREDWTYREGDRAVELKATSTCGDSCKTIFLDIEQVTIRGLYGQPLVLTDPGAMVYAPAHHNFSWQFAFDLSRVQGMNEAEKAAMQKDLGGRYLVLDSTLDQQGIVRALIYDETGNSRAWTQFTDENNRLPGGGGPNIGL